MNSWIKDKEMKKLDNVVQKAFRWMTPKTLAFLFAIGYFISLIPLLWIGFYNVPSADDFGEASRAHLTWMSTHNVLATIGSGLAKGIGDWFEWMGYYTCNILMALSPITFGEKGYWLVTFLMVGALSLSTIYLLYMLFMKVFHFEKYCSWCVIFLMLFATVQCMPGEGRGEAFYWYSGAVNYIFVHSLANLFYGLLLSIYVHKEKKQIGRIVGTSVLGFFVGGGNQMTMLNVAVVLVLSSLLLLYHKKWKRYRMLIAPFSCFFVGMVLNVIAPGNFVRSSGSEGMHPIRAISISLHYGLDYCVSVWTTWPVLVLFVLIAVMAWRMTANSDFAFPCPGIVVLMAYCLVSAMMTPPLFAVGNMEAGRLQALTYVMYILSATLSIVYVVGWLRYRHDQLMQTGEAASQKLFSIWQKWSILGLLLLLLVGGMLDVIPTPEYFTFSEALMDLRSGDAKAYYASFCERVERFADSTEGDPVVVEPYPVRPALLFFSDITTDTEYWENRSLARYLGVEEVALSHPGK